jgi:putative hydrolase of the HAD superfamily
MIKNIIFDLGGIIFTIDEKQAVRRFKEIGLKNADEQLDPYRQSGYFGELESGKISAEEFRQELSTNIGHTVTLGRLPLCVDRLCERGPSDQFGQVDLFT